MKKKKSKLPEESSQGDSLDKSEKGKKPKNLNEGEKESKVIGEIENEDELSLTVSINSIGNLNWNVTGTADYDDTYLYGEMVQERAHELFASEGKPTKASQPHRHHHGGKTKEKLNKPLSCAYSGMNKEEELRESKCAVLMAIEEQLDDNLMCWDPLPIEIRIDEKSDRFVSPSFLQEGGSGRRSVSVGADLDDLPEIAEDQIDVLSLYANMGVENLSYASSAPPAFGDRNLLKPSSSIEEAFAAAAEMGGGGDLPPAFCRNNEDVPSIISTEFRPDADALRPRNRFKFKGRVGLLVMGVALLCGLVGVAVVTSSGKKNPKDDAGFQKGATGRGRGGGRGGGFDRAGCPAPEIESSIVLVCDKIPVNKSGNDYYPEDTLCRFHCADGGPIRGPSEIHCQTVKSFGSDWCVPLSGNRFSSLENFLSPKCDKNETDSFAKGRKRAEVSVEEEKKQNDIGTAEGLRAKKKITMTTMTSLPPTTTGLSKDKCGGCLNGGSCIESKLQKTWFCDCLLEFESEEKNGGKHCDQESFLKNFPQEDQNLIKITDGWFVECLPFRSQVFVFDRSRNVDSVVVVVVVEKPRITEFSVELSNGSSPSPCRPLTSPALFESLVKSIFDCDEDFDASSLRVYVDGEDDVSVCEILAYD